MDATRDFDAFDPRDKIYGLLGVANEYDRRFAPDYTRPTKEVFQNLVRFLVQRDHDLDCLPSLRMTGQASGPSWVPALQGRLRLGLVWLNTSGFYHGAGSREAHVEFDHHVDLLKVHGVYVDVLRDVIGPFTSSRVPIPPLGGTTDDLLSLAGASGLSAPLLMLMEYVQYQGGQRT